jgi:signal peptidase I
MKTLYDNDTFFETIKPLLNENQVVSFMVKGTSMKPFLKDGQTEVFLKTKEAYRPLDMCLFKFNQKYVLHRLIKINDKYVFRGDALYTYEEVDQKDILAYVYQYQTKHKMVKTEAFIYKFKVRCYLLAKSIKFMLRSIVKGKK